MRTLSPKATFYVVLPFQRSKKGVVVAGHPKHVNSRDAAMRLADRLGVAVGAIAFSRTGDPQFGEWEDAVILARVGEIPEDFDLAA